MDIPITPAFFSEIGIYERLKEYEREKEKKPIWYSESVVLMWADSDQHQQPGSFIDNSHTETPLKEAIGKRIPEAHKTYALNDREHVLASLVAHGFADANSNQNNKLVNIRINQSGFIAGKILRKTKYLQNIHEYERWLKIWWWTLWFALLVFFTQSIKHIWEYPIAPILLSLKYLLNFCSL